MNNVNNNFFCISTYVDVLQKSRNSRNMDIPVHWAIPKNVKMTFIMPKIILYVRVTQLFMNI